MEPVRRPVRKPVTRSMARDPDEDDQQHQLDVHDTTSDGNVELQGETSGDQRTTEEEPTQESVEDEDGAANNPVMASNGGSTAAGSSSTTVTTTTSTTVMSLRPSIPNTTAANTHIAEAPRQPQQSARLTTRLHEMRGKLHLWTSCHVDLRGLHRSCNRVPAVVMQIFPILSGDKGKTSCTLVTEQEQDRGPEGTTARPAVRILCCPVFHRSKVTSLR